MRLLVLGGTKFLGRAIVEEALARGHEVTTFTRGETNPELFPEAERLRGDRDGDLSALEGRTWDAVIDTSGYVPRIVRASAEALRNSGFYVFVSSISVYAELPPGYDESSPVEQLEDPETEDVRAHYGALKAACERVVDDVFGERAANLRFGLIVGPHDPTDRFTYWADRVARGGEVLAPGAPRPGVAVRRRPGRGGIRARRRGAPPARPVQRDELVDGGRGPRRRGHDLGGRRVPASSTASASGWSSRSGSRRTASSAPCTPRTRAVRATPACGCAR